MRAPFAGPRSGLPPAKRPWTLRLGHRLGEAPCPSARARRAPIGANRHPGRRAGIPRGPSRTVARRTEFPGQESRQPRESDSGTRVSIDLVEMEKNGRERLERHGILEGPGIEPAQSEVAHESDDH